MADVEHYAILAATSSKEAFRDRFAGSAVLVRLDERGGRLDPAPWAFPPPQTSGSLAGPRRDDEVDAEALRAALEADTGDGHEDDPVFIAAEEEPTATTLAPPPVHPPAGGAASVLELPAMGGSGDVLLVGRGRESHVYLAERSMGRRHARLIAKSEGFVVEDAGSSNGTRLNGRAVPAGGAVLASGDVLAFGDVECVFLDLEDFYERLPGFMD